MLTYALWRARIEPSRVEAFDELLAKLDGVVALVAPALAAQAKVLKVPPEDLRGTRNTQEYVGPFDTVKGEIFTSGDEMVAVTIRVDRDGRVLVDDQGQLQEEGGGRAMLHCAVLSPKTESSLLKQVKGAVAEAFGVELTLARIPARRFDELVDEGRVPVDNPTEAEIKAAEVLSDRVARKLAIGIKTAGGLLVKGLPAQVAGQRPERVQEARENLESAGLLDSDVVVVCSKGGAQVNRLPSREVLPGLAQSGLRCSCGRPIDEEECEDAVSISDLGRVMLDGSRWMTVRLVQELQRCGVGANRVLVDQQTGGDEMDCIADVYGSVLFFELKDKEFSLGNAYSFGAKMGIVRPDVSVIVTTEHVGGDAKTHFEERARSARRPRTRYREADSEPEVRYIEGIDQLRIELADLTTELALARAQRIFGETLALGSVNAAAVTKVIAERTRGSLA